jgi:putative heme degradation protein
MRVEHEYERMGALAYLAAWDARQTRIFGRLEPRSGIAPFDRLVEQVMLEPRDCCASRAFWIVDNGSSHRGQAAIDRLAERWPNLCLVHLPVHASWLNQIEIYFERRYQQIATPFAWKFTRADLNRLLARLAAEQPTPALLAA